ncbi:MAG: cysteine--tRNA ligase [Bacteroidota bacterium]
MKNQLFVYNTLSRKKELFEPLNPPHAGMYVCGPTVYGDAHLGHARAAIVFDLIFRYLTHLGYNVRYVRNITDVGHLENDSDEGEDKIAKKARLERLEPMEVVQRYTNRYHDNLNQLNTKHPSIEPRASGHIIEQISMIKRIMDNGFAYEVNGSVYFDVVKYSKSHHYGKLSGRVLDDLISNTRELDKQSEKKNNVDFALWKKALPEHIMKWPSPWSDGFPGWHVECSTMGAKYLGEYFDIHGGGIDLLFPHHECEIAQSQAANNTDPVKYWLHNNLITIDGQKMSKSLNNFITLYDIFSGDHKLLRRAYSPMTVRFFILQAHYRGTLDFSNEALQASGKGLKKLMAAITTAGKLKPGKNSTSNINELEQKCYQALNDDFNSPVLVSHLFEGVRIVNSVYSGEETITKNDLELLRKVFAGFVYDILGLSSKGGSPDFSGRGALGGKEEETSPEDNNLIAGLIDLILSARQRARKNKDFETSDKIREGLTKLNIITKDEKDGTTWSSEGSP